MPKKKQAKAVPVNTRAYRDDRTFINTEAAKQNVDAPDIIHQMRLAYAEKQSRTV